MSSDIDDFKRFGLELPEFNVLEMSDSALPSLAPPRESPVRVPSSTIEFGQAAEVVDDGSIGHFFGNSARLAGAGKAAKTRASL